MQPTYTAEEYRKALDGLPSSSEKPLPLGMGVCHTRGYSERITVNANSIEDATAQIKNRFRYWDYVSIDKAVTNRTPVRPKVKVRL